MDHQQRGRFVPFNVDAPRPAGRSDQLAKPTLHSDFVPAALTTRPGQAIDSFRHRPRPTMPSGDCSFPLDGSFRAAASTCPQRRRRRTDEPSLSFRWDGRRRIFLARTNRHLSLGSRPTPRGLESTLPGRPGARASGSEKTRGRSKPAPPNHCRRRRLTFCRYGSGHRRSPEVDSPFAAGRRTAAVGSSDPTFCIRPAEPTGSSSAGPDLAMAIRHGAHRPAGFPVSRPLTFAKPNRETPPASTTCAAYPTKPDRWSSAASRCRRQVTIERNGSGLRGQPKSARLSPPTGGRRPSDRRSDLHGRSRQPARRPAGRPALSTHLPFSSHGPSSVRAARDRARDRSCRGLRHDTTRLDPPSPPPARPDSPSSSAPPSPFVQSSRPFPPHDRPEGRRRPLTTHRNGSAHPPPPKSACLSASCRANAPARPDRRVRPCSLGSTSFPAPARPVPAGLRPPHPLSIWPAQLAGARTPGGHDDPPGPPDPKPPPPGNDSVPTARTRSPIHHRADRTAGPTTRPMTGRPMERCRSIRSIPTGRSDPARPSPGPDRRRPGDSTGWPADRAGGGVALPARVDTAGGRTDREGCLGLPFSRRGGVPSRSAPVPAAAAGVGAIGQLELVERRVGPWPGPAFRSGLPPPFPSITIARTTPPVTTARNLSPVRR